MNKMLLTISASPCLAAAPRVCCPSSRVYV